jgi:hypothetical protein
LAANNTVLEGNIGVDEVRGIFEHFWALGNPSASA